MARSGQAPFGYTRRDGRLVVDPQEGRIRLRIYELFIEHKRKKTVAEVLNYEGHRTRSGAMFTGASIRRMLLDPNVIGVAGEIDALVPKSMFEQCQGILKRQEQKGGAKRKARHLFAGITFCVCGDKMYVPSNSHKYTCQSCKAKIHKLDLEVVFIEQLKSSDVLKGQPSQYCKLLTSWSALNFDIKRTVIEAIATRIDVNVAGSSISISVADL